MGYVTVFKRYELKYLITREQKTRLLRDVEKYMRPDRYGRSTVRNVYFDTESYLLIRRSIEKPIYKEKLRIRSYMRAAPDTPVFVEIKKKYDSVVYKRRLPITEREAMLWVGGGEVSIPRTQIYREIDYFLHFYEGLEPRVFLSYEREAYYALDDSDFRITFDENILARCEELSLGSEAYGTPLLDDGRVLMEIKCSGGIPLFMAEALSREKIYKTSFSKYGEAYKKIIFPKTRGINNNG